LSRTRKLSVIPQIPLIDIRKHRKIWEDFYDTLLVKERESEPRESLKKVKKKVLSLEGSSAPCPPRYAVSLLPDLCIFDP
jgi:hypothetical protein